MVSPRRHKLLGWPATGILLAVFSGLIYWTFIRPSIAASANRRALSAFASQVDVGDPQHAVRETFEASWESSSVKFREYEPDCWAFETPLEFGAGNWILIVSFDNGSVDGVGIRTADTLKGKPRNAPADRVLESATSRWKNRFGPDWES